VAKAAGGYDYDLVIIGCGVGGHGAALHAVEQVGRAVSLRAFGGAPFLDVDSPARLSLSPGTKTPPPKQNNPPENVNNRA
jgi:hypothetical protein